MSREVRRSKRGASPHEPPAWRQQATHDFPDLLFAFCAYALLFVSVVLHKVLGARANTTTKKVLLNLFRQQ